MKALACCVLGSVLFWLAPHTLHAQYPPVTGAASVSTAQESAVDGLLRLHHEQRVAHVLGDAGLLVSSLADSVIVVEDGRISMRTRASARGQFAAYFDAVRFLEWEDVRPPRIRLSPDGRWAEVAVEKRVRTIPGDTTRSKGEDSAVFAWVSRWTRNGSAWQLASITSTDRVAADTIGVDLADRVRAYEILRRGREAVGGQAAVARVATLFFSAECEGPDGPFVTEVASARDGRVALMQRFSDRPPFAAGVSLEGEWRNASGEVVVDTLNAVLESVVSAHELHLLAIAPEARYTAPRARSRERVRGRDVDVVRFTDRLGAPVDFLYDAASGRPAGLRLVNRTGRGARQVSTWFDDWRRTGDIQLPFEITIEQGGDVYRYRVIATSTEWLTDAAFRASAAHPGADVDSLPDTQGYENARILVPENARHFPFLDRPDAFFPAVGRFLDGDWPEAAERLE